MVYKVAVSSRTNKEIEAAINYYVLYSADAPHNFILAIEQTYLALSKKPLLKIRYKNIRAIKVKGFPYMLYYVVDEKHKTIKVLSCFHGRLNPQRKPKT